MASIQKIQNKGGISYKITVLIATEVDGRQIRKTTTYKPPSTWSEAKGLKEAQKQAFLFEEKIKQGYVPDGKRTFREYAAYVIELKRSTGVRESTLTRYEELLIRVNREIGAIKLMDLRPTHLNSLYQKLKKDRVPKRTAIIKADIEALIESRGLSRNALAKKAELSGSTITNACRGLPLYESCARKISDALGVPLEDLFTIKEEEDKTLSDKTVLEHHRVISTILDQAEKEMLVPYNAAKKATLPKVERKEPNYFQPEDVHRILAALDTEPLKYRLFMELLIITGCRRGEIAGLKWDMIDLEGGYLRIERSLNYSKKKELTLGPTKTGTKRRLKISEEIISLLKQHKAEQDAIKAVALDYWTDTGFVFTADDGMPANPSSWTSWMRKFAIKHGLPHINPHAFRHTAASVLLTADTDVLTVSKILGHASPTTTQTIYAHVIERTKDEAADKLSSLLLKRE